MILWLKELEKDSLRKKNVARAAALAVIAANARVEKENVDAAAAEY